MTEQGKIGPQYPAQEGSVISGDPAQNVAEAGATPPQATRKKKKKKQDGPSLGQTFAQAEQSDLLGVVLVQDHTYIVLKKAQ